MSWQLERAVEREEEFLSKELSEGRITIAEFNRMMRDLHWDAQAEREAEAEAAYEAALEGYW